MNAQPRRPVFVLREEARAIFGRISSSRTVEGQLVQLNAAVAVGRHLIDFGRGPGDLELVFDGLQEGFDHLVALIEATA